MRLLWATVLEVFPTEQALTTASYTYYGSTYYGYPTEQALIMASYNLLWLAWLYLLWLPYRAGGPPHAALTMATLTMAARTVAN